MSGNSASGHFYMQKWPANAKLVVWLSKKFASSVHYLNHQFSYWDFNKHLLLICVMQNFRTALITVGPSLCFGASPMKLSISEYRKILGFGVNLWFRLPLLIGKTQTVVILLCLLMGVNLCHWLYAFVLKSVICFLCSSIWALYVKANN